KTTLRPLKRMRANGKPAKAAIRIGSNIPKNVIMMLFHKYNGIGNVFQTATKFSNVIWSGINLGGMENTLSFGPFKVVDNVHKKGTVVNNATSVNIMYDINFRLKLKTLKKRVFEFFPVLL